MPVSVPPRPPRQRSLHPSGADSAHPAAPGQPARPPPAAPRRSAAYRRPSAPRTDQLRARPRSGQQRRRSLVAYGDPQRHSLHGGEFARSCKQLAWGLSRLLYPQKNFATVGIQGARRNPGLARQHQQPRNGNDRNLRRLGQPLHGAQAHAHAGKTAGAIHYDNAAEIFQRDLIAFEQFGDSSHQRGRIAAAFELLLAEEIKVAPREPAQRNRAGRHRRCRLPESDRKTCHLQPLHTTKRLSAPVPGRQSGLPCPQCRSKAGCAPQ